MATRLESLQNWLQNNKATSFKHIRREGNKVADFLANLGAERGKEHHEGHVQDTALETDWTTLQEIIKADM